MDRIVVMSVKQAHLIWMLSLLNISLGWFIPGFDALRNSISAVALEAPAYAYTHRAADILIGISMCVFGVGMQLSMRRGMSFSMLSSVLFGLGMISAGIWTLETPLHLLYNISIFMIVLPLAVALEFSRHARSPQFELLSCVMAFVHALMFWLIYAGFIPSEYNGLIQRLWALPTMGWFGLAAVQVARENAAGGIPATLGVR
ncbi:DUF998 domain-containing protein [Gallaecimonas kandeliae]|uniref:DUF998 domain-containing protein n=1 Tax=Gallaecimonas kandeliae TaxID=3029055 RepID=UPI002648C225|nr:DUF998 domain-containing protein [Gallaecimonas kandeliae]WKE66985.1 DUF998 domain-containing protein [Gallaecimonas kandeliae]